MRFYTDSVLDVKELADIRIRIVDVTECQSAVTAFRNTGRIFTVSQFSLKTKVTVFSDFLSSDNEADVVGASRNAVFATHTSVRIHRNDIRDFISMCSLCRTDYERKVHPDTAGKKRGRKLVHNPHGSIFPQYGQAVPGTLVFLSFKNHTMNTRRQFINFATRFYTFTASNALVLVEHQNIMRIGSCVFCAEPAAGCPFVLSASAAF